MTEIQSSDQIKDIYENILRSLDKAGSILELELPKYTNFLTESAKFILNENYQQELRIKVAIIYKNLVIDHWQNNQQRKQCREVMLNGLVMNVGNMPMISTLSNIIVNIIQIDPPHIWPNPLQELINWMEDYNAVESGLELFLQLFYKLGENSGENTQLLKEIVPNLLERGFTIFAQPELNESLREKILILIYQVFRSISYADGTDNQLINTCLDSTFQIWMSLFLSALQTSPKSHIYIKKLVLKILIVIFRDFSVYSRKSLTISLLPVWKFFNSIAHLYIAHNVYGIELESIDQLFNSEEAKQLPISKDRIINYQNDIEMRYLNEDDEYENHIEGLCAYSIELITILVAKPALYNLIKFGTFPLINTLSVYLTATRKQEKIWLRDPSYFMQNDEEELLQKSVRTLALKLINDIIEKYGDQFVQQILLVGERLILNRNEKEFMEMVQEIIGKLNFSELKGVQQKEFDQDVVLNFVKSSLISIQNPLYQQSFIEKKKETGYLLLGNFSEDIIVFQSKHQSTFEVKKCIQNIMLEIERNQSKIEWLIQLYLELYILKARSLWCASKYSDLISFQFKELFVNLIEVSQPYCNSKYPLTLRLIGCKAIGNFSQKIMKYQLLNRDQISKFSESMIEEGLIENILMLLQEVQDEQIFIVLEAITQLIKLSSNYAIQFAKSGSKVLLQFFSVFHPDSSLLKVFNDLLQKICLHKESYNYIFDVFCPFILDCFQVFYNELSASEDKSKIKQQDINLMSAIMNLTSTFVRYCQDSKAQDTLITLFPSMVNLMLINEDSQLQVHTSQCLKSFIIIETGQILRMNLVQDVMKVNLKLLEVPQNSSLESASLFAGNLVMITINNLLDGNPDINLLKAVVYKIFRSRMPSTVQPLVLVYARMINQNAKECLNFLTSWSIDNRIALKVLIDKWLLQQPLFRGKATKNATFTALKNLFMLKDKTLETLLVIGYNPSHQNINSGINVYAPFKILSLLIRCLDNEIIPVEKEQGDNERLEMDEGEEDDDYDKTNEMFQEQIEVDLEKIRDDEDQDIAERFKLIGDRDKKDKGLADLETGSTLYMSEFLDFNQEVGEECDETTEEDLNYLKDPCLNIDLIINDQEMLKQFFNDLIKNDLDYLKFCLKHLLKEDVQLLSKHIKVKFN